LYTYRIMNIIISIISIFQSNIKSFCVLSTIYDLLFLVSLFIIFMNMNITITIITNIYLFISLDWNINIIIDSYILIKWTINSTIIKCLLLNWSRLSHIIYYHSIAFFHFLSVLLRPSLNNQLSITSSFNLEWLWCSFRSSNNIMIETQ